ncbi:hypothetical protein ADK55_29040 [Streptomyces sp. WM4235]|uniref:hypothetical protein n=1 Tax=Streptomyces sp. WM4235 TaxID=1415551 RepID=UPI0006AF4C29|nr:hypothetical protein [Streptomyces sp. WM4235]KOU41245.1 hypothetical protein ADK55_29040 [Streptomyces sp. WM4235]
MRQDSLANDSAIDLAAAVALLMAAVTFRDLLSAMSPAAVASMPTDLLNRASHHRYQAAFDQLPADLREQAQIIVDSDPDVVAARQIDAEGRL